MRTQSQNAVHENSLDVANGLSSNASSILKNKHNKTMEKINPKELGLLVKSQTYRNYDREWLYTAIETLIRLRVTHCSSALDLAMSRDEAYLCNHSDSEYIIYVDQNGEEYGHFSAPLYNVMVEFLDGHQPYSRLIIQQAIRQYLYNKNNDNAYRYAVMEVLSESNKIEQDLENALTEMIVLFD